MVGSSSCPYNKCMYNRRCCCMSCPAIHASAHTTSKPGLLTCTWYCRAAGCGWAHLTQLRRLLWHMMLLQGASEGSWPSATSQRMAPQPQWLGVMCLHSRSLPPLLQARTATGTISCKHLAHWFMWLHGGVHLLYQLPDIMLNLRHSRALVLGMNLTGLEPQTH